MIPTASINALTARWIAELPDDETVCSGVAVWPLLALLADAAEGEARDQLAAAAGLDPATGTDAGLAALRWLHEAEGVSAALGLWRRHDLPVRREWLARMPEGVAAIFTGDAKVDQDTVNAWARERTEGLIDRMPLEINDSTRLLLATALMLKTTWREPFGKRHSESQPLRRVTSDPSIVRAGRDVTCVRVEGDNGIDVHLVLGEAGTAASSVLTAGLSVIGQTAFESDLDAAPGLVVDTVPSQSTAPQVSLTMPAFTVRATHNLLASAQVFGLAAISDCSRGHLPSISETPLCINAARQDAVAQFSEKGFRAAAITAVALISAAAMPRADHTARRISVTIDRPFGFLATHRESGLVLVAGWVTEPFTS